MKNSKVVQKFAYSGCLTAPASKSYLQRALAIASLAPKGCRIENFYPSADALAALEMVQALGCEVKIEGNLVELKRGLTPQGDLILNCGEAGLGARMFASIVALHPNRVSLNGIGSINTRPMHMLIEPLEKLGVTFEANESFLPLHFTGPLHAAELEIDGSESSQVLTGLLIALTQVPGLSVLHVNQLKSKPYIQMTLDILADFGAQVTHDNFEKFLIPGPQVLSRSHYFVEGDWSGAAFHLVGAAISGRIEILGLNQNSAQADRAILDALLQCGADIKWVGERLFVSKNELRSFVFDATDCPDLFPSLAVLAACCDGTSKIKGVNRLIHKESNRGQTIQEEFAKLNIPVILDGDWMKISKAEVRGGLVSSRNDHRIAMALAVLATVSSSPITIEHPEAVHKSYPTFFEDLEKLGTD